MQAALAAFVLVCGVAVPAATFAQTGGEEDKTFLTGLTGSTIFSLLYMDEDNTPTVFIGGDNGTLTNVNLNDGSTAGDFALGTPFGSLTGRITYTVQAELEPGANGAAAKPDGLVLVGGLFGETTATGGQVIQASNIGRLFLDGTVDTTFNPGNGANNSVFCILPLPDGTSILGGAFTVYNSQPHNHIAKMEHNGAADPSFNSKLSVDDNVIALASQIDGATGLPNGQILAVGTFNNVSGVPQAKIVRLNADGSVDKSFRPQFDTRALALAVQTDGKILVGGQFATADGVAHLNMARLNQDGSLDPTFNASFSGTLNKGFPPPAVYRIVLLPHGQMLVGGNFTMVDGIPEQFLTRLYTDGTVDLTFNSGTNLLNSVQDILVQPDTNLLIAETFIKKINNVAPEQVVRLYSGPPYMPPPGVRLLPDRLDTSEADFGSTGHPRGAVVNVTRGLSRVAEPLTVNYTVSGSAVAGRDYKRLSGHVSFPANQATVPITVKPLGDDLATASVDVIITLSTSSNDSYRVGAPAQQTVKISNK